MTSPDEKDTDKSASVENGPSAKPAIPAASDVEKQRCFNELRRERLDYWAKTINWWLAVVAIFLTFFAIGVAVAGYMGFGQFQELKEEAKEIENRAIESVENAERAVEETKRYVEETKRYVEEIKSYLDEAKKMTKDIREMNAQIVADAPENAKQVVASVREDPTASLVDQAVARAVSLQQQGKREEAIEKWRAVAHVAEAIDNDRSAGAWFSVGYLLQIESEEEADELKLEEAIGAYDKAIRLKSDYAEAYNDRGNAKDALGRRDAAIADYDEAIKLKPDFAEAYYNRGLTKDVLGRHDAAIADYNEAIKLKPDFAEALNNRGVAKETLGQYNIAIADYDDAIKLKPDFAKAYYNRGRVKITLGLVKEARADLENALVLARIANNANLVALAEQSLRSLDTAGDT